MQIREYVILSREEMGETRMMGGFVYVDYE
jgi:hypothetical protein